MHERPTPNHIKPFSTDLRKSQEGSEQKWGSGPTHPHVSTSLFSNNIIGFAWISWVVPGGVEPPPTWLHATAGLHNTTKTEQKTRNKPAEKIRALPPSSDYQSITISAKNNVKSGTTSQHPPSSESNEKRNPQHEDTHRNCVEKKTFHLFIQTMMVVLSGNRPRKEVIKQIKQLCNHLMEDFEQNQESNKRGCQIPADHRIINCRCRCHPTPCSSTQTLHRRDGTGCRLHTGDGAKKEHEIRN